MTDKLKMNPNISKIYIHMGMTKTATSSIEATLYDEANKEILNRNDLYFPIKCTHHKLITNKFSSGARRYMFNIESSPNGIPLIQYDDIFEDEILQCRNKNAMIYAEAVGDLSEEELIDFKNYVNQLMPNAEIELILCVREFYSWTGASIQQVMKVRGVDIKNYIGLRYRKRDNTKVFQRFINVFGKESIVAYKFEDACKHENGPVGYFLELVNIREGIENVVIHKENEGFSENATLLMNYINNTVPIVWQGAVNKLRQVDDIMPLSEISGRKYRLDKSSFKKLKKIIKKETDYTYKEFGIDYYQEMALAKPRKKIEYAESYFSDMTKIFPELSDILRRLVYDYHNKIKREVSKKNGRDVLTKINAWIEEMYPEVLKIEIPKEQKVNFIMYRPMMKYSTRFLSKCSRKVKKLLRINN